MVLQKMDALLSVFLDETRESLDTVEAELIKLEQSKGSAQILNHILRVLHNVKGTCGFLNLPRLQKLIHAAELTLVAANSDDFASSQTINLYLKTIDRLKEITCALEAQGIEPAGDDGEILTALHVLAQTKHQLTPPTAPAEPPLAPATRQSPSSSSAQPLLDACSALIMLRHQLAATAARLNDQDLSDQLHLLTDIADDLQADIRARFKTTLTQAWAHLPRVVRDIAHQQNKVIAFEISGSDLEIDRELAHGLKGAMTQLLRNAAVHGLEPTDSRSAAGKNEKGRIKISIAQRRNELIVRVADDGHGLQLPSIKAKAILHRVIDQSMAQALSEHDAQQLVFAPGVTTAAKPEPFGGFGIGLDVVRRDVEALSGIVSVTSKQGKGTIFTLRVPLTTAQAHHSDLRFAEAPSSLKDEALSYILFKAGDNPPRAVPFQLVTQVATAGASLFLDNDRIQLSYEGKIIPAIDADPTRAAATSLRASHALVFSEKGELFAVLVDAIVDVIKTTSLVSPIVNKTGIAGICQIGAEQVEIVDVSRYVERALQTPQAQDQKQVKKPARRNYPLAWSSTGRTYV